MREIVGAVRRGGEKIEAPKSACSKALNVGRVGRHEGAFCIAITREGAGNSKSSQGLWPGHLGELCMVQQVETDHKNVSKYMLEERWAYRVLKESPLFDLLWKEVSNKPKGVGFGDLELQGPTGDVEGRRIGVHLELRGNGH